MNYPTFRFPPFESFIPFAGRHGGRRKPNYPSLKGHVKLVLRLLFSHVILLLVCLYAGFGAWLFVRMKYSNEDFMLNERKIRSIDVNDNYCYFMFCFYYLKDKARVERPRLSGTSKVSISL
ncbi:hypothetical protein NPIL_434341 [Nephila pilipes]|uniref:Uncharacterized protein n=1 Tax=Nephila pilipes TaxID=299642 RepID=A0A8X6UNC2_NEPPI|nr:hypothetical protein NPIL_434341 [Nephila pilipes]